MAFLWVALPWSLTGKQHGYAPMISKLDNRISLWTAEFVSPDRERQFRTASAPDWHAQIRLFSLVLAAAVVVATVPFLVLNIESGDVFTILLIRIFMTFAAIVPAIFIWRGAEYRTVDVVVFLAVASMVTIATLQLPYTHSAIEFWSVPIIISTLFVYLLIPNRTLYSIASGVFLAAAYFGGWAMTQQDPEFIARIAVLFFAANAFGIVIRSRLPRYERSQFISNEALREGQARLRALFQQAPEGIVMVDAVGTIQSVNPAFLDLFRYTEPEVIGKSILSLAPQDWREALERLLSDLGPGQGQGRAKWENTSTEATGLRSDGSTFPFEFAVASMALPNEQIIAAFVRDLTDLQKVDRIQNEFISTVSHELRTPLTSIKGSLGLIRSGSMGEVSERVKPLVEIAYNNSDRLIRLINDILDLDKIQAGMMDFKMQPLDLTEIITQSAAASQGLGDQRGISYVFTSSVDKAEVQGDHDRLCQVMANLLSNATKFSPTGGRVEISISRNGPGFRVAVTDHGTGISEEFRDTIFDRFTQAEQTDSSRIGGTGLGLSICKSILDHHQGTIGFKSEVGRGSKFYFDLPERIDPA